MRVYRYGIEGSDPSALRRQAWPYLLGLLNWSENIDDRYRQLTDEYSAAVEEWKKLEKIVRVRDHEAFTAGLLKFLFEYSLEFLLNFFVFRLFCVGYWLLSL